MQRSWETDSVEIKGPTASRAGKDNCERKARLQRGTNVEKGRDLSNSGPNMAPRGGGGGVGKRVKAERKKNITNLELGAAGLTWFFGLYTHAAAVRSRD